MATALAVIAAGCAKEQVSPGIEDGQEVIVSYNIAAPQGLVTKAISDGQSAKNLTVAVYDSEKNHIATLDKTATFSDLKATVEFHLVKGKTYNFIFWAQSETSAYKLDPDNKVVKISYNGVANDESRDAFFATRELKVTGALSETVELYRPFAQVNFGTADFEAAKKAGVEPTKSTLTATEAATELDLFGREGKVSNGASSDIAYTEEVFPTEELVLSDGTKYKYLSMNYFIPVGSLDEQHVSDLKATFTGGADPVEISVPSAPVQANYRTNIVGNLLTDQVIFNIEIKPAYKGEENLHPIIVNGVAYTALDKAVAAAETGKQTIIQLVEDLAGDGVKAINGQDIIIDLGGHTFDIDGETVGSQGTTTNGMQLLKGSKVTIKNGTIKSKKAKILIQNYCDLTLENVVLDASESSVCRYVLSNNHGNVNILGSTSIKAPAEGVAFDIYYWPPSYADGVNVYVNTTGAIEGKIEYASESGHETASETYTSLVIDNAVLTNSSFKPSNLNPNAKVATSVLTSTEMDNWIPDGYKATVIGDYYIVTAADVTPVADQAGMEAAIEGGGAIDQPVNISLPSGATVNLKSGIADQGTKSRDITITGDGSQTFDVVSEAVSAEGGMLSYQRGSTITLKNMTVKAGEGNYDGIVCDELTLENCTITGKLSLYGKATFKNCVFDNTMNDQYSIWTWGGTDVKVEGCTFNTLRKAILLYGQATAAKPTNLTVSNTGFKLKEGGTAEKAAIEIGNDYNATYNLVISGCTVEGFAKGKNTDSYFWGNKNSMDTEHLSVTIDGVRVH